jgi:copper(I)-binding protein
MTSTVERIIGWTACGAAVALLVVAMLLSTPAQAAETTHVSAASVRLPAVSGRPGAGYFTLHGGAGGATLVGVVSPLATRIELHSNNMAGGVMRMDTLPAVKVGAGESVSFSPGGNHLMIFGLAATLKPGATVPLTFRFADGRTVKVDATTVAAGATPVTIMGHTAHQ